MKHSKKLNKLSYPFNAPKEKETIRISLASPALGDTIAWIPVIEQFRKSNGTFPTINRMLNLFLKYLCNN